jgi:hypothetical protein
MPSSPLFYVAAFVICAAFYAIARELHMERKIATSLDRQLSHRDRRIATLERVAERRARHIQTFEGRGRRQSPGTVDVVRGGGGISCGRASLRHVLTVDGDAVKRFVKRDQTDQEGDGGTPRAPAVAVAEVSS